MSLNLPTGILSAASIQELADELGYFFHFKGLYELAHKAWKGAFTHRNTPPTVHDAAWCHDLELIGLKLHTRNRPGKALKYLCEALDYKETTLSHDDIKVCDTLVRIARALVALHEPEEAEPYFRQALNGYAHLLSGSHAEALQTSNEFAYSLACQATHAAVREAELLARRTLKARERYLGRIHQETVESVWTLGFAVEKVGRRADALHLYERAYEEGRQLLGEEHVDVMDYKRDFDSLSWEDDETVQWLLL